MKRIRSIGWVALIAAGLVLASACGKEAKQAETAKPADAKTADFTGDPESAYCRAALEWALVELKPRDGSVASETKYWNDYAAFLKHGQDVAPSEIKPAWELYANNGLNNVIPVLRKYGFDEKRFTSEATAAEKKAVMETSQEFDKQFERILGYEWQVCGNGTPDSATDVKFTGDKNSAYCKDEAEGQDAFNKVRESGFDPAVVKAFFTSKELADSLPARLRDAPANIKADVEADVDWIRTKQIPALAKWSYDFTKVKLQAPAADRFAIDMSAVEIRDVERRLNAYDEQVCGL